MNRLKPRMTTKTQEMKEEEEQMLCEYHGQRRELALILGCDLLFFCPCLRCGTDLISEEHKIGTTEDGRDIFKGYYCKTTGRPPVYQFDKFKEGHGDFMRATDALKERLKEAGYPMPDPARVAKVAIAGGVAEEAQLKEAEDRITALKMELDKVNKEREAFKVELEAVRKELGNLKTKLAAVKEGDSEKGEEALRTMEECHHKITEELKCKNKMLQEMYDECLLKAKEAESTLAGSHPMRFMALKTREAKAKGAAEGAAKAAGGVGKSPLSFAEESASLAGDWGEEEEEESMTRSGRGSGGAERPSNGRTSTGERGSGTSKRWADAVGSEKKEQQVLINSTKLIKVTLKSKDDVVEFLENVEMLVQAIEEFYGGETDETKIKIALLHMGSEVKIDGDVVFKELKNEGVYSLKLFMERLFALNFPSPWSSLDLAFRELKQGESSIIEYSRKFRLFVGKLELNLKAQKNRFLAGLRDGRVRQSMYKQNIEVLEFDSLVRWCVTLTNNMKLDQPSFSVFKGEEKERCEGERTLMAEDKDEGLDACMKIMGVSLAQYWKVSEERGVGKRCFQCFSDKHGATQCPLKICKFCDKEVRVAQHYSVMCPKCPKNLTKFLEARDKAKFNRGANNVRFTDDYDDYHFESEELSE